MAVSDLADPTANTAEALADELRKIKLERSALGWGRLPRLVPQPELIIDVGASNGTPHLYKAFPKSELIMIDAIEENARHLEKYVQTYQGSIIISGVGSAAGRQVLNIAGNASGSRSSFLPRHGSFEDDIVKPREIPVARLDELVPPSTKTIGLKLDVEGYEAEVLTGAEGLLPQIQWVVAEVSLAPRFKGDPLFEGVYGLLRRQGFRFRDIVSIRRNRTGDLRLIDAVFVRKVHIEFSRKLQRRLAAAKARAQEAPTGATP